MNAHKKSNSSCGSYCGDYLRAHDPDRFLISMFVPAEKREGIWALFAFNHEIAKTRDVVSEATLGHIRLQWWRDAIKDIYEKGYVPEHEVLKPLSEAIEQHNLPKEYFDKLLYAREFDLEDVQPANLEGLMNYADFTTQPLLQLAVQICGDDPDQEVIQPVAINYAMAGIIRATAHNARHGFYLLPEDLMHKHQVTKESVFEESGQAGLKSLIEEMVTQKLARTNPNNVILKSSEALSDIYFKQIRALGYDVMSPSISQEPNFKVLRLFWRIKLL